MGYVQRATVSVDDRLARFIEEEVLGPFAPPGLCAATFWDGLAQIVSEFGPQNSELLKERVRLQGEIDAWHRARPGPVDPAEYAGFLERTGYLTGDVPDFTIGTDFVDREIFELAGPQLVVPGDNARFVLNAANARWGSLYDALYGTDAPGSPPASSRYDTARGKQAIAAGRAFLDRVAALEGASWADVTHLCVDQAALAARLADGSQHPLRDPSAFAGFDGEPHAPHMILLCHHGLHVEIAIDRTDPVGREDRAGIRDIVLESALTAIVDFEDSVAAVDGADKVHLYRNWLGLMTGTLAATFEKNGRQMTRRLAAPRLYRNRQGLAQIERRARTLLLVRNVGHLMTSEMVRDAAGEPVHEGLLDGLVTALVSMIDVGTGGPDGGGRRANSPAGAIYIVKPKMHSPWEVAFADRLFARIEEILKLRPHTLKMGIMDEERRCSVNLKACIAAAQDRVFFVNTGFLDRTGDEIHTSMNAGPVPPKAAMKGEEWLATYEARNVDVALACGFRGRAQIGKGMWAMPDAMAQMMREKIGQLEAGATTAWVPSPTAATLHALDYHTVDVWQRTAEIAQRPARPLSGLLALPLGGVPERAVLRAEIENNAQGILGYVVRWVDQGIGCSKVPDINDVALMEDRATCRISSQQLANWLHHGVCSADEVEEALRKMAVIVDRQNAGDDKYTPMAPDFDSSLAFRAARALVFEGRQQPSGYTEPILHRYRLEKKAAGL